MALEAVDLGCFVCDGLAGLVQRLELPLGGAEVIAGAGEVGGAGTVSAYLGDEVVEALDSVGGGNAGHDPGQYQPERRSAQGLAHREFNGARSGAAPGTGFS